MFFLDYTSTRLTRALKCLAQGHSHTNQFAVIPKKKKPFKSNTIQWFKQFSAKNPFYGVLQFTQKNHLTLSQTTDFKLFQTERGCRQQFQIRRKWQKVLQTGRKHCGKRRNCS